jgi:hypothetical protein
MSRRQQRLYGTMADDGTRNGGQEGIMVRLPDATDQIRLAPVRALRAVFSGVGQLLLAADRLREEDARQDLESADDQQDTHPASDGRLSSSVRLITPTWTPAPSSSGKAAGEAGAGPGGKSKATARRSGPRGRKAKPTGQPGSSATAKARPADSVRGDRPSKATKQPTRARKNVADAKRPTATKAANTGARKSGRSRDVDESPRFRSLDLTGNVRMLTYQDITDLSADELRSADAEPRWPAGPTLETAASAPAADTAAPYWSEAAPPWSSWSPSAAEPPEISPGVAKFSQAAPRTSELPISGYDELSLPSLRARLRNLDAAELAELLAHERSHANRQDVVTMFVRRIAKLEGQ